ncbi:MAG: exonuclease SbcCD subunit D C-terminal domain-containing protein [Planctomycetota bacterium]
MRLLHTADWHLGHTLRDHERTAEHAHFLRWLVDTVVERRVDALLLAGDVFDAANPPPSALRQWFQFLGDLKRRAPLVQVVVIAGNHDSAARLEAPRELLAAFDVRVIGAIERRPDGALHTDPLLVPLRGADGGEALCVAIPFLRTSDVLALVPPPVVPLAPPSAAPRATPSPPDRVAPDPAPLAAANEARPFVLPRPGEPATTGDELPDPLLAGMARLHDELFAAARAQRRPGQALLAIAHGYLVGGALSELSERKVLGGNQHALPLDLFPDDCAYVALGHLHRPQTLGGREHVRYSGSPLPLSMPERLHAHHVVFCDLDGERTAKVWSLRVPRLVPLLRIPERGELSPEAALAAVAALPPRSPNTPVALRPLVEVAVRLPQPSPQLGERIARAIADRDARLVRVEVVTDGDVAAGLGDGTSAGRPAELAAWTPEQVFERRFRAQFEAAPPDDLLRAFRDLLEQVQHQEGP